jgi:hypothetical protein
MRAFLKVLSKVHASVYFMGDWDPHHLLHIENKGEYFDLSPKWCPLNCNTVAITDFTKCPLSIQQLYEFVQL